MDMNIDEDMMVDFVLNSLHKEFKSLRNTYIAQKECWTLNYLITISVQQEHNNIREQGAKLANIVQTKQYKENENKDVVSGKEKEKENNNSKALKPVGLKYFFYKMNGHMKKECRSYKK